MDRFNAYEVKALETSDGKGAFEALVAVFGNVDTYGDRIIKGAFERTLEEDGLPPIVWSHDWRTPPVGATLKATETDDGLVIAGQLFVDRVPLADHVYAAMSTKGGDGKPPLRQFSFGYDVRGYSVHESEDPNAWNGEVRDLTDLKLLEVGPCLIGVNPSTELLAIKGVTPAPTRDQNPSPAPPAESKSAPARMSREARNSYLTVHLGRR